MKKEITMPLNLSEEQKRLLDMHGFLNILTVLQEELLRMKTMVGGVAFEGCLGVVKKMIETLAENSPTIITTHQMLEFQSYIEEEYTLHTADTVLSEEVSKKLESSRNNIRSIFRVIHVRVRELLLRSGNDDEWITMSSSDVRDTCLELLEAMVKNSKKRFGVSYKKEHQKENDYLVDIDISGYNGSEMTLPLVILQSFQDLIANSRKYTPPGGTIHARLKEEPNRLIMQVKDNGFGIPEDQFEHVVEFGFRARNVLHKDTKGGGFGLTKAYYVTKKLNGRFWIDSKMDSGTTITAEIPKNP
ncbi:sensor histidine kinase [Balneolaceae bacterium ANBcel3]|nr:sensor histidine kinase [Balneolaceae bacterium ANBcel3]